MFLLPYDDGHEEKETQEQFKEHLRLYLLTRGYELDTSDTVKQIIRPKEGHCTVIVYGTL